MRDALALLDAREPDFMYDGEMHVDAALDPELRERIFPTSRLQGVANVLVFADTDAASGVRNILKMRAGGPGGRADPDGHGQPRPYRDTRRSPRAAC